MPDVSRNPDPALTLFLCGDVMTGRGIDQILPHPGNQAIHEPFLRDAREYVHLAESVNGPVPAPVSYSYIWGDALDVLEEASPDARIVNLETAITRGDDYRRGKGINYRMHPDNIRCLTVAKIDCCALANNHVLDWGCSGLLETLDSLRASGIRYAGAGRDLGEASGPSVIPSKTGRVLVFSYGSGDSGIPADWAASSGKPGVNYLNVFSDEAARAIGETIRQVKQPGDAAVVSIHWGENWGYDIPAGHIRFAHALLDTGSIDCIHGHSSHHVLGIEVYRNRPIFYGCGDFINDYEGIGGYEAFRGDLSLMYFMTLDPRTGDLKRLGMVPMQMRRLRVNRASRADARWLREILNREGARFGTGAEPGEGGTLTLIWE